MEGWVRVARADEVGEGAMRRVEVGGEGIGLARIDGQLFAFRAACPHASADLTRGDLRPGFVICPLHAYRFDLATGRCLKPRDGPRLRRYEVAERDGAIWLRPAPR